MEEVQDRVLKLIDYHFEGNLAKACREFDIPQSSLTNIVRGKRNKPSFDNIIKIVSHPKYHVSLEWFVLGVGEISDIKMLTISEKKNEDYKLKYEDAKDEIIKLQYKLNHLYEFLNDKKEGFPNFIGDLNDSTAIYYVD